MASLACSDDQFDWLWGSLRPWQILHSTLAARERNGSTRLDDVWELVNEALTTGASTSNHPLRREIHEEREAHESGSTKWALGMRLLANHDGEFWRHGGVMESRVREWLISSRSSDNEDQQLTTPHQNFHCYQSASSASALHKFSKPTSSDLTIASSSGAQQCQQQRLGMYERDESSLTAGITELPELGAAQRGGCGGAEGERSEAQEDEAEEEEEEIKGSSGDGQLQSVRYGGTGAGSMCGDYAGDDGESRVVVSRCCSGGGGDDRAAGGARAAAAAVEVCAVCLEKLNEREEEEEEEEEEGVQVLACQHLFHEACIAPWLQRQPHARCPCCRAPILDPPRQLHSAAPLNLEPPPPPPPSPLPRFAGSYHQHRDIMALVADMEAVLEHLGFRD